jgi:hypothetical protein
MMAITIMKMNNIAKQVFSLESSIPVIHILLHKGVVFGSSGYPVIHNGIVVPMSLLP